MITLSENDSECVSFYVELDWSMDGKKKHRTKGEKEVILNVDAWICGAFERDRKGLSCLAMRYVTPVQLIRCLWFVKVISTTYEIRRRDCLVTICLQQYPT